MSFNINPSCIYLYTRVSTRAQVHKSNGLEDQHTICSEYINNNFKNNHVEYFEDIGSSYQEKNKLCSLNKILRKISTNSLLVVRDISRLGRNTFQVFALLRKIKKTNSHIVSVSENLCWNYSRLMDREFSHKVIDAEKDSDIKSNKNIIKNQSVIRSGGFIGNAPYGTQIVKINNIPYIYKNPQEINIINLINLNYEKLRNVEKVATLLNKNNILNRKNVLWNNSSIRKIVKKHCPNKNVFANIPDLPPNLLVQSNVNTSSNIDLMINSQANKIDEMKLD